MPTARRSTEPIIDQERPVPLAVGVFGGASAVPVRVARDRGLFARNGLVVTVSETPSSDALADGLLSGAYQVIHAAPDNVVAWSDRSGVPVVAWIGGSNGPVALVSRRPGGVEGLRGARIGVDAPTNGYAPLLWKLLRVGGIEDAVEVIELGATRRRAAALQDGTIDATMLSLPWSALAVRAGATIVADHRAVAPGLLTSAGASRQDWLREHPDVADRYLRSWLDALAVIADPDARPAIVADLAADLAVDADLAGAILDQLLGPAGWPHDGAIEPESMEIICALRADVVGPTASPADAYVDHDPVARAAARTS